jgi:hypothetical protein
MDEDHHDYDDTTLQDRIMIASRVTAAMQNNQVQAS